MEIVMSEHYYSYPFNKTTKDQGYAFWKDGFSKEDVKKIIELGESNEIVDAKVGNNIVDSDIRESKISWINPSENSIWLFDKMCNIASILNNQYFGFNLSGMLAFQYTIYNANTETKGFYDWHIDRMGIGDGNNLPRKLSLILQLSDPMDYEGGEIWIHGLHRECMPKTKGLVIAFPGNTLHRVTPVTSGIRKSLVAWIVGPDFI
jgi:PKHD-type hydroxylase